MFRIVAALFCLRKVSQTFVVFFIIKLIYWLLVLNIMLSLSVRFLSKLLAHRSFWILRALTILTRIFFFVFLPVMWLPRFRSMLAGWNWCNISVLTVVVPPEFIVAIGVKEISIRVDKRTIFVNIEPVFIVNATRRESIFFLWATLLVILFLFAWSVIWLRSHWAARRRTSSSRVSILIVLFATNLLLLTVRLSLFWFRILFWSYVAILVWMLLLILATSPPSSATSLAIIEVWRLLDRRVLVNYCTHFNLLFLLGVLVRLPLILLCSIQVSLLLCASSSTPSSSTTLVSIGWTWSICIRWMRSHLFWFRIYLVHFDILVLDVTMIGECKEWYKFEDF
jgi:hypothetical protein